MYTITTICIGPKYTPLLYYWKKKIEPFCSQIEIFESIPSNIKTNEYAWWDVARLIKNLNILITTNAPVVHIDMDVIIRKDITPLVQLEYDLIFSQEIGGAAAFPKECSSQLGFGICSGFYIIKPSAIIFLNKLLTFMQNKTYKTYSDQSTLMNYIVTNPHTVTKEIYVMNKTFHNHIIHIDGIKICVLDFALIVRDPIISDDQYADHINIDNVGGVSNFIKYFNEPLQSLPLTCRCGKSHLGDNSVCPHIALRAQLN
jgi:hypothetical protein